MNSALRRAHPPPASIQEQIHDVARPGIELGGRHRRAESHGPALRQRDDHVKKLPCRERRVVQRELSRPDFTLEDTGDEPDRFVGRSALGRDRGQFGESRRFRDQHPIQSDGLRRQRRAQDEPCQPLQDLLKVPHEQLDIAGRTQAIDDAMDDGDEKRGFVVEAMVEGAFGNACPSRDRFDARGAVPVRHEQMRRGVENPLAESRRLLPRRATAAAGNRSGRIGNRFSATSSRCRTAPGRSPHPATRSTLAVV